MSMRFVTVLVTLILSMTSAIDCWAASDELARLGGHARSSTGVHIYVLDTDNERVQIFDAKGNYQSQFSHSFNLPIGITLDARQNLYIKGNSNCQVEKFNSAGNFILAFGICGAHTLGRGIFDDVGKVAADSAGNVWVTSPDFYYMQKVDRTGNFQGIVCMANVGVSDCPPATDFPVQPQGIALDLKGNIYVTNVYPAGGGFNVVKFDNTGRYLATIGSSGSGDGQFNDPEGIAVDSEGDIYVSDSGNNRVQKFDKTGAYKSQFGTLGSGEGQFSYPVGIAMDSAGNIYVTDVGNNRVQKFDRNGVFLDQFGSYGQGAGEFFAPYGVAISE